jgi:hypothetical protein
MKSICPILVVAVSLSSLSVGATDESTAAGKEAEQQACTACHSTRLIDSQRLSRAAWTRELDKMIGWGAPAAERQLLIDYLSSEYSDAKPVPTPASSGNGVASQLQKH